MKLSYLLLVALVVSPLSVLSFVPTQSPTLTRQQCFQKRPCSRTLFGPTLLERSKSCPNLIKEAPYQNAQTALFVSPVILATEKNLVAVASMTLLAFQFGTMPTLQKKFIPKNICRSSVVMAQEVGKFTLSALCLFLLTSPLQRQIVFVDWSIREWWKLAAIPAALYAIQNYAKLMAYQHLPSVTYSVLNQTKTLSTAIFCYILLGIRQSPVQMAALVLLLFSALVIEEVVKIERFTAMLWSFACHLPSLSILRWKPAKKAIRNISLFSPDVKLNAAVAVSNHQSGENASEKTVPQRSPYHVTRGVLPLMLANLTSGLAAALGQKALQHHKRNLYLYSMELSSASFLMVLFSLLWTKDGRQLRREGLTKHWKRGTWLPIGAHAVGGILVGLVTKFAGSVKKGFALIFGVLLSGLLQKWISHEDVTHEQIFGGILACISLWMHSCYPPITS